LWDDALAVEVRELPDDLAALDGLLADPGLLAPIVEHWRREIVETRRAVLTDGRPTIAMETYIRLMVLKQRYRWGYRTLVAEVSDSIHLRRFCRISLSERVPDESTPQAHETDWRGDGERAHAGVDREGHTREALPRAVRIDSTVVEADVAWRRMVCVRSPGRPASSARWSESRGGGCGIAQGRWVARCGP
jgi:IS5 family transposase